MDLSQIKKTVENALKADEIEVYHVRFIENGQKYLEIILLKKGGFSLSLEQIEQLTPRISALLDQIIAGDEAYFLDIYSPLFTLPLFTDEHYQKVLEQEITVAYQDKTVKATLIAIEPSLIIVKKKNQQIIIDKKDIIEASFNREGK